MAVFIHKNRYGINNNEHMERENVRGINRDFKIVEDPTLSLFIEPYKCGIKDEYGNILYFTEGSTESLKPHYSYNICVHKKTKEISLFVESGINIPRYLPLRKV